MEFPRPPPVTALDARRWGGRLSGVYGPSVRQYVRNQVEHHRVTTFEEEYSAFLRRHEIEFEPRRLFEDEHHG